MSHQMERHCEYRDPVTGQCRETPLADARNGYCIFHAGVEDKTEEEFKKALADYVDKIKKENLAYSFVGFVFVGATDFQKHLGINVLENAEFRSAHFHGDVDFFETEFHGNAGFAWTEFYGDTKIEKVEFQGEVRFASAKFKSVSFRETRFGGEARFNGTLFRNTASFKRTRFEGGADFEEVTFSGDAEFNKTQFWPTSRISVALAKGKISFAGASLENVSLTPLKLHRSASIDFTGALLRNTQMKREDIQDNIADEREKRFSEAGETYLLLKNNFHSLGRYEDESWAFKKEKDFERKSYFHARSLRWLGSMFWNLLYGYGEKPFWILGWCGLLLLLSSFIYWLSKGVFQVLGTYLVPVDDYWNNLYFSVVTFTILGYGDFRPIGKIRVLASIEAFLGIFFIALFIFAFARKTGGR